MPTLALATGQVGSFDRSIVRSILSVLLLAVAFGIYWHSAYLLDVASSSWKFSADTGYFRVLYEGKINDRAARFHPLTFAMGLAWMKIFSPLELWLTPLQILKTMFAGVGALGVWATMWAFSAVVPRRYVLVCGLIYASSFAIWYFSSIEESKLVTATLSALYIGAYLHLRDRWTRSGAALLTLLLLLACLNEIMAGLLVIIPFVDTLVRRGWDFRYGSWIAVHALAGLVALAILEFVVNGPLVARSADPEGASMISHLLYYLSMNDYRSDTYPFLINWLFFNVAAPTPIADFGVGVHEHADWSGEFEPALVNYLMSPLSIGVVVSGLAIVVASLLPRYRAESLGNLAGVYYALIAYAVLRAAFFLIYLPGDPMLNSPASTLAHLLIVLIPFALSRFPAKQPVLLAFAALLFLNNGMFFISQ
jgi:hypothetical protein